MSTSLEHRQVDEDDPTGFFTPKEERSISDVIYESIPINTYLNRFIDTEHFQRLRDIKQLGTSSYVWPNASHTRFEHCLGVAYLARSLVSHLQSNQPDLGITNRDVGCVEIAGLCHDLGHGPWSHVWDNIFMPAADKTRRWQHELGSEMMFDDMVKKYEIPVSEKDIRFIKALIAGEPAKCDPSEKLFLFDIIANKRNGLDVDKFDYIQRDSHMTGESFSFPADRIVKSAKVLDNQLCYNIKDANQIYRICQRRFDLHKHVYNHKTARAIEYMIVDALLAAEPYMKIAQRVYSPDSFLLLNDHIMHEIQISQAPELQKSRDILARIRHRDLYRCVDFKVIEFFSKDVVKSITSERILEKIKAREDVDITENDIIVDISTMHHGMKEHNPVDFTKFYYKRMKPDDMPMKAGPGDYSELRPSVHAEILFRVYTKKPQYYGLVQRGYRDVIEDANKLLAGDDADVSMDVAGDTRPTTPDLTSGSSSMESTRTPALRRASLPKTPGSETGRNPAGGEQPKRAFGRVISINHFTSVDPKYVPQSPLTNPRRTSVDAASRTVSDQSGNDTPSPLTLISNLPGPSGSLSDLFDETPGVDVVDGAMAPTQDVKEASLKRGRNDELLPLADGGGMKRRKEGEK